VAFQHQEGQAVGQSGFFNVWQCYLENLRIDRRLVQTLYFSRQWLVIRLGLRLLASETAAKQNSGNMNTVDFFFMVFLLLQSGPAAGGPPYGRGNHH